MAVDRLLIFAKRPAAGHVKTRLTPPLPPDEAAAVYEACLRDVITLCARERATLELWYHNDHLAEPYFANEFPHIVARSQCAGNLGEKMLDAFARTFEDGAERVIIMGSDVPTLSDNIVHAALDDVRDGGMVLGPTSDGGYYLIGLDRHAWSKAATLFDEVAWSTAAVFHQTIANARRAALDARVLPGWYDVDTIEDLRQAISDADAQSNLGRWAERPDSAYFLNAG